jgi:glycosyltransferase involved in cell wall biosynthesis
LVAQLNCDHGRDDCPRHENVSLPTRNVAQEVHRELVPSTMHARAVRPEADEHACVEEVGIEDVVLLAHPLMVPAEPSRDRAGTVTIRRPVRILLVSQMYPGVGDPDLGVFVANLERELMARGHEIERAVIDRRGGGRRRHAGLAWDAVRAARRFEHDVVYAHFLVPAGLAAALASRAPLVVTAHGQDVANVGAIPGARAATRFVVRRAAAVVAVSGWLRAQLVAAIPEAALKTEVVDCGVDLDRFAPRDREEARHAVGLDADGTAFLCLGALSERKNVLGLARAFERRGEGTLTFVGDGSLRDALEGREGIRLAGRVPHDAVPAWLAASDVVCQPSLVEPFGLATLEAMASARSVVATRVGGAPEFVTPESGVLVDPEDDGALAAALDAAAALPRPNLMARAAAESHDVRLQAARVEAILERAAGFSALTGIR